MAPRALFQKYDIFAVQQQQEQEAKAAVRKLPIEKLRQEDEEKLSSEIANSLTMELPVLDVANVSQTDRKVQIDARRLPNRMVFNRSRPVPVDGTEITIHIPFKGEPSMFDVRPSTHDLNPPVADIDVTNREVLLTYETADADNAIKASYERTLQAIQKHLEWLRPAATRTDHLKQAARSEIAKCKQADTTHARIVDSLGIPKKAG
jgi:hypothetical protein